MSDRNKGSSRNVTGDLAASRSDSSTIGEAGAVRQAGTEDDSVDGADIPRATDSRPRGKTEDPDRTL